jgi:hypothetical protein
MEVIINLGLVPLRATARSLGYEEIGVSESACAPHDWWIDKVTQFHGGNRQWVLF